MFEIDNGSSVDSPVVQTESSSKLRRNGFHAKYLAACKAKNMMPLPEVKIKQRNHHVLDFHCDRIKLSDWESIFNALANDASLEFVAIRLRKNLELVREEIDNFKKAKAIQNHPVFLTKFVFSRMVETLNEFLSCNDMIKVLLLEGLPLNGNYMTLFAKSLSLNSSITTLSLSRSMIEDESCDALCSTVKHLPNIESLDLSSCNLGVKGAESVADLIRFQKIQRFSEGWKRSLRYQVVNPDTIPGLKKINLNFNIKIGDEGLQAIAEILKEDVWIKEIEMQSCGITDEGAQHIIQCLDLNKTIVNFNIGGNPEISEHLYRHIVVQLGKAVHDNFGTDLSSEKISNSQLRERIKYLEEQLQTEVFRRKRTEDLNEQLHEQVLEVQKELIMQGSFQVPDGYTVILNETLEKLMRDQTKLQKIESAKKLHRNKKLMKNVVRKAQSSTCPNYLKSNQEQKRASKSECLIKYSDRKNIEKKHFEKNMGDYASEKTLRFEDQVPESEKGERISGVDVLNFLSKKLDTKKCENVDKYEDFEENEMTQSLSGLDVLKHFAKKRHEESQEIVKKETKFDPRNLFHGRADYVPNNSDVESNPF